MSAIPVAPRFDLGPVAEVAFEPPEHGERKPLGEAQAPLSRSTAPTSKRISNTLWALTVLALTAVVLLRLDRPLGG